MPIARFILAATILLAAGPAAASGNNKGAASSSGEDCTVSYALFEGAVPHIDLESCPASMGIEETDVICRASVANDMLTVYAFEDHGFMCLKALRSYESSEFKVTIP